MVSFPSRDKEWLFTTANTPVSEDKCHTCEGLSGTNLFLNDTFNSEGVRGVQGDLKQQRGEMAEYTFRRFRDHMLHTRKRVRNALAVPTTSYIVAVVMGDKTYTHCCMTEPPENFSTAVK